MTAAENVVAVTLPSVGDAVTGATITRWLKAVGASVELDEPLLESSSDKVDTTVWTQLKERS